MTAPAPNINDLTARTVAQRLQWVKDAQAAREFLLRGEKAVNTLLRMLPPGAWANSFASDSLDINLNVKSMREVAPILESLEDIYGVSFDKEETYADHGMREFKPAGCTFLKVTAWISDDAQAACRRVVVGEKVVPQYEVVCDGEAPAAPAPQSAEDAL